MDSITSPTLTVASYDVKPTTTGAAAMAKDWKLRGVMLPTTEGVAMHVPYSIRAWCETEDPEGATRAIAAVAVSEFGKAEAVFSPFAQGSEISAVNARLAAGETSVPLSQDLAAALAAASAVAHVTAFAYDPACWQVSASTPANPSAAASVTVGADGVLHVRRPVGFDLCGIAKGRVVDAIAQRLCAAGFNACLVEWGGDIRCVGTPGDDAAWRVQVAGAGALELRDEAVATSGDAPTAATGPSAVAAGGAHHIRNPRFAGVPRLVPHPAGVATVTIVHPVCEFADALATAFFVHLAELAPEAVTASARGFLQQIRTSGSAVAAVSRVALTYRDGRVEEVPCVGADVGPLVPRTIDVPPRTLPSATEVALAVVRHNTRRAAWVLLCGSATAPQFGVTVTSGHHGRSPAADASGHGHHSFTVALMRGSRALAGLAANSDASLVLFRHAVTATDAAMPPEMTRALVHFAGGAFVEGAADAFATQFGVSSDGTGFGLLVRVHVDWRRSLNVGDHVVVRLDAAAEMDAALDSWIAGTVPVQRLGRHYALATTRRPGGRAVRVAPSASGICTAYTQRGFVGCTVAAVDTVSMHPQVLTFTCPRGALATTMFYDDATGAPRTHAIRLHLFVEGEPRLQSDVTALMEWFEDAVMLGSQFVYVPAAADEEGARQYRFPGSADRTGTAAAVDLTVLHVDTETSAECRVYAAPMGANILTMKEAPWCCMWH